MLTVWQEPDAGREIDRYRQRAYKGENRMGLFDFLKGTDFNEGIETYKNTQDAVLLDVRTQQEYLEGRVPGSWNIPLREIGKVEKLIDKAAPLFVYCLSGARSRMAVAQLQQMGYARVTNLGGINSYRGKVER